MTKAEIRNHIERLERDLKEMRAALLVSDEPESKVAKSVAAPERINEPEFLKVNYDTGI